MIGLKKDKVRIVAHKTQWKELYLHEEALIGNQLQPIHFEIEHIGSTAIPGIAAKPILDIMLGVKTMVEIEKCVPLLEEINYIFKGEFGIPNRYFFIKEQVDKRTHHLHLVTLDSDFWKDLILFRNYLLKNPNAKSDYERLKRELAKTYPEQREKYTDSKSDFIHNIIKKAKKEL